VVQKVKSNTELTEEVKNNEMIKSMGKNTGQGFGVTLTRNPFFRRCQKDPFLGDRVDRGVQQKRIHLE